MILPEASLPEGHQLKRLVPEASNSPAEVISRGKKRRHEEVPLPRDEKWKRRLPWGLRRVIAAPVEETISSCDEENLAFI